MSVFSCDLVEESRKHVRFLEGLHVDGAMLTPVLPKSLDRYINHWLPLVDREVAHYETVHLIPPPDIAWLWHCHRLAPMNYERHVRNRFATLLEASPSFSFQCEEDADPDAFLTRDAWYNDFPNEPFFLQDQDECENCSSTIVEQCRSLEGFDLVASTQNQAAFLWQVSGPKFREDEFLYEAVENYHKFLKLSCTGEHGLPLVPTYQIDLMWHTHILKSLRDYQSDCIAIRGEKFHHDDSLNDRAPGATLDLAFQATQKLWEEAYNQDYSVEGGMYRGEPPSVYYNVPAWQLAFNQAIRTLERPNDAVVGASSVGRSEQRAWFDPKSNDVDEFGNPAFIPANARGRERLVNTNEQKAGYIFGAGTAGDGFYHMYTRAAYMILYKRLCKQEVYAQSQLNNYLCSSCLCCGSNPSEAQRIEIDRLEEKVEEIRTMKNYVLARSKLSCRPDSDIGPALIPNAQSASGVGSGGGILYYPMADLCTAGGCGGGAAAGGCG
jgi:hypothetical protein